MATPVDIAGLLGPAEQLGKLLLEVKRRWDATEDHPFQARRLKELYDMLGSNINALQRAHQVQDQNMNDAIRQIVGSNLAQMRVSIENASRILKDKLDKIEDKRYAFRKTDDNESQFNSLEKEAAHLEAKIISLCNLWSTKPITNSASDEYSSFMFVKSNDSDLALDYLTKDAHGTPVTHEGKLLSTILDENEMSVSIVVGIGGVGKTCALKGLASCEQIRVRFPGGVFFISLGKDATVGELVRELSNTVAASGGSNLSERMKQEGSLDVVFSLAGGWFKDRECLFLFDDIWQTGISVDFLHIIAMLSNHKHNSLSGNRIVVSTRDQSLCRVGHRITFEPRKPRSMQAKNMLIKAAGLTLHDVSRACDPAIIAILDVCQGLPLLLSLTGRYVLARLSGWAGDPSNIWGKYAHDLSSSAASLSESIATTLSTSLAFLDGSNEEKDSSASAMSYRDATIALCVIRKQDWVPLKFLERLWGDKDHVASEMRIEQLARFRIVEKEIRQVRGELVTGLRLHDLVHDFSQQQAVKDSVVWYKSLSRSYQCMVSAEFTQVSVHCNSEEEERTCLPSILGCFRFSSKSSGSDQQSATQVTCEQDPCWPALLEDDGYIFANIGRVLLNSGQQGLLRSLLRDVRWVVKMMHPKYIIQYEQDVSMYLKHARIPSLPTPQISFSISNDAEVMNSFSKIARMSLYLCEGERQKRWFQLFNRLQSTESANSWVKDALESILRYCDRPFLRPATRILRGASEKVIDTFNTKNIPMDVKIVGLQVVSCGASMDGKKIMYEKYTRGSEPLKMEIDTRSPGGSDEPDQRAIQSGDDRVSSISIAMDGTLVISGHCNGLLQAWGTIGEPELKDRMFGHTAKVKCVACSPNGKRIVAGSENASILVWDVQSSESARPPFLGHTRAVKGVDISADGRRVVSGSEDETVRIWDPDSGQQLGDSLTGHTDWVECVAISRDGRVIVSGSQDETVRVWDALSGNLLCAPFTGHKTWVTSLSISADGRRVASGSEDKTVQVWDIQTGELVCAPLCGHTELVSSTAMSADGQHVASGSTDKTVRLWDVTSIGQDQNVRTGHNHPILSVAMSEDKKVVASGSVDGTVRVWDAVSGEQLCPPLRGHEEFVTSVAMSANGMRVVSGSDDRTIRVWNVRSGDLVRPAMTGHTMPVSSVAMSSDGSHVLSCSYDNTVRFWDVENGTSTTRECSNWNEMDALFAGECDPRSTGSQTGAPKVGPRIIGSGSEIKLRRPGQPDISLAEFESLIWTFAVSTDVKLVVAGLRDGTVGILHLE